MFSKGFFVGSVALAFAATAGAIAEAESQKDDTVETDDLPKFIDSITADLNSFWKDEFSRQGFTGWKDAAVVVFGRVTKTKCGPRLSKQGVMYCTKDWTVYVPPSALMEFRDELGVRGDMAQAFALAHELAHHAQLGFHITRDTARNHKKNRGRRARQKLKIAHELQADCFAGLWAHSLSERGLLEDGDIGEVLAALAAIGDDALHVRRARWSHGSGKQRAKWFSVGFETGDFFACDPFNQDKER